METNGINYENGLPTPSNGTWLQTIAYLLDHLNDIQYSALTSTQSGDTTVSVIQSILLPQSTHIEVYDPHKITKCSPNIKIEKRICTPPPKIVKLPKKDLYMKCCGPWNPQNSTYVKCMTQVDRCYQEVYDAKGRVIQSDITRNKCIKRK